MNKLILLFLVACAAQLEGAKCPQPTDCQAFEYAKKASDAYTDHQPPDIKGCDTASACLANVQGFRKIGNGFYAEVTGDDKSGFVIAFRGTKEGQDIIDEIDQGLNGQNEQFAEAMDYFEQVKTVFDDCHANAKPKTIVGHSLGGALAQYAAGIAGD